MDSQTLRESVTGAIRYWEPRRLLYNAVLAAIVLNYFGIYYPTSKSFLSVYSVLGLFLLVVLANVAYCAAYPVDIFVCASSYRDQWRKHRRVIFMIGLLFAAIITRYFLRLEYSSLNPPGYVEADCRSNIQAEIICAVPDARGSSPIPSTSFPFPRRSPPQCW